MALQPLSSNTQFSTQDQISFGDYMGKINVTDVDRK